MKKILQSLLFVIPLFFLATNVAFADILVFGPIWGGIQYNTIALISVSLIEAFFIFWLLKVDFKKSIKGSFIANISTTLVGVFLSEFFLGSLHAILHSPSDKHFLASVIVLIIIFILNLLIESIILRIYLKLSFWKILLISFVANLVTYLALILALLKFYNF